MELFTARVCPYAHRTRLVLLEKGLEFEHIEIDFKNKSERFLAVSPYGKVPALVHDRETIYESAIINEYLDEAFPDPPLMPSGALVGRKRMASLFAAIVTAMPSTTSRRAKPITAKRAIASSL
jgi:glutathione S-transferase